MRDSVARRLPELRQTVEAERSSLPWLVLPDALSSMKGANAICKQCAKFMNFRHSKSDLRGFSDLSEVRRALIYA
jgi:hypothetical protein